MSALPALALIAQLWGPGTLDCQIPGIPPIPPVGCIAVEPVCVCDEAGNCRTVWRCVRG